MEKYISRLLEVGYNIRFARPAVGRVPMGWRATLYQGTTVVGRGDSTYSLMVAMREAIRQADATQWPHLANILADLTADLGGVPAGAYSTDPAAHGGAAGPVGPDAHHAATAAEAEGGQAEGTEGGGA